MDINLPCEASWAANTERKTIMPVDTYAEGAEYA
jgi:hypothetical protein